MPCLHCTILLGGSLCVSRTASYYAFIYDLPMAVLNAALNIVNILCAIVKTHACQVTQFFGILTSC